MSNSDRPRGLRIGHWPFASLHTHVMTETLLAPNFLFRYAVPCRYKAELWSAKGTQLDETYTLPYFGELEGKRKYAELRAAWSEEGLAFALRVEGKSQPPWCRDSRIEDCDGLQVWIDTRNTQNIHRAGRFCHRFGFYPVGIGRGGKEPFAAQMAINRAKESPREMAPGSLRVSSRLNRDGYEMDVALFADALTGFNSVDQPQLGFFYAVLDKELGLQTFSLGREFPFDEDPSLWGTLQLVK
jgi:hypothetical protein